MKTIILTLISASVLGLLAAPASALETKKLFEQQERRSGGAAE